MYVLISCNDLKESTSRLQQSGLSVIDVFSVTLASLTEGVGRVALSKMLGLTERTVRKITMLLKIGELHWLSSLLEKITINNINAPWLTCKPVLYGGFSEELLNIVSRRIVLLRDFIIISSKEPGKVEVLGVLINGDLAYPGLVGEYCEPYLKLREILPRTNGLLVCWRNYKRYLDDSVLLVSLAYLCEYSDLMGGECVIHREKYS